MRLRRRGLVGVGILVCGGFMYLGILGGCESTGDGKKAEAPPTTTAVTPTAPTGTDVVGITLTAGTSTLIADGTSSTTIAAALINSAGKPASDGIVVTFTTDKGRFTLGGAKTIAATTAQGTGTVVVPFISEAGVTGSASLTVSASGVIQSLRPPITLTGVGAGPPATITLTAASASVLVGGTTRLTAQVSDAQNNKVADGTVVNFTTSLAETSVTSSATTTNGAAVADFTAGPKTGVTTVTATAASASATLSLTIEDIVAITLTAGTLSLTADGVSSTTITATLKTTSGGPAPDGIVVLFTTDKGRFTTAGAKSALGSTSRGTGSAVVPFISVSGEVGTATIVASIGSLTQKLLIAESPSAIAVAGITLTAGSTALVATGTSSTTITAKLIDSIGRPSPDGIVVAFTTDRGRFTTAGAKSAMATTTQGTATVIVPFISEPGILGTATVIANVNGVAQSVRIALTGAGEPAKIILAADATGISLGGTTGITAEVLDKDGNHVADGTAVTFTTSLAGTGVTPSVTTTKGVATAVFSAGTKAGVVTVTATAGTVAATVSISIQPGNAGSLEFVSADPTAIGVRGSALPQTSTITFRARDQNGNPVADGTVVTFAIIGGVGGGEFVVPTKAGTVGGLAATVLSSGTVSGPVRVKASVTVGTTTFSSSSTNVSMEGGPPSGAHISLAPSFVNIAGQVTFDIICPIDAKVGDRFGNPVPPGTAVSFFTNGGIVGAQGATDELGDAPSRLKTAAPIPHVGTVTDPTDARTGMVTVIAVTQGEETFLDKNGNGVFDGPQEFDPSNPALDTPEPFIDHITVCTERLPDGTTRLCQVPADPSLSRTFSGNNQFDPSDPFELFIDGNGNGMWDTPNGVWDASKPIFASTRVLFSGPTVLRVTRLQAGICTGDPNGFVVPNGGVADLGPFCILVSDPGGHPLVAGTTLTVRTSVGTISGTSSVTLPDTQQTGLGTTEFVFTVIDSDQTDTDPPQSATVIVTVNSPATTTCPGGNGNATFSFGGSVD